jgi:Phosphotransferase enzyme family
MPRDRVVEVPMADLRDHPAAEAWGRLAPDGGRRPNRMFVLKPEKKRSAVYRLEGAARDGSAVVAKRGRTARVAIELRIYREVLPRLPAATLRCYGSVDDERPGFSWLFLEDAGEQRFSSGDGEHRALAARWLGLLHTSIAERPAWQARLPGREVGYYRTIVSLARDAVGDSLANPAFTSADVATLEAILRSCDLLESRWSEVEGTCRALPHTLVHGDFGPKNVRVRRGSEGLELLPLDWDSAGWGVAASDLSQTDVGVYWLVARTRWPELEPDALARLATVGRMFLALESITGEVDALRSECIDNVMRKMRGYRSEMDDALITAGWTSW